jgi:Actinobacteria/chloroflexi VLRF1 release factor
VAGERFEIPPERLGRWLGRWADEHGGVAHSERDARGMRFEAADGATLDAEVPFPPFQRTGESGFAALVEHAGHERLVGVLLVRLGGHAAGVFDGTTLVDSKVGRRNVHGRHKKGGSSQKRFERRRGEQARVALQSAADVAARILVPYAGQLDALVTGGDRTAIEAVLEDPRLAAVRDVVAPRVLDVPDPRLSVLRATPDRFRATILRPA